MRLSASNLWRAALCPGSVVLPQEKRVYADAERGAREHKALEASPPPGSHAEVAFALNVLSGTSREVGRGIGRNYGKLAHGEIPGTADLVTVCNDHVLVTDYKTGVGYLQAEPAQNLQLKHNGIAAAAVFGKPRAVVQLVYTKTGEVKDAAFDAFDFQDIKDELRGIWEQVNAAAILLQLENADALLGSGLVNISDACWRCPAKKACPAQGKTHA